MIRLGIHSTAVIDFSGVLELPATTVIEPLTVIYGGEQGTLRLGERNILYPGCAIRIEKGSMTTGCDVSFGPGCQIYEPRAGLEIGNHCLIAGGVMICGVQHGHARLDIPMRQQSASALPIIIEDDVWLGMGVKVLPGVCIGKGSIIGAGSVVTHDIPPHSIAMGVPCRVVRRRTEDDME